MSHNTTPLRRSDFFLGPGDHRAPSCSCVEGHDFIHRRRNKDQDQGLETVF